MSQASPNQASFVLERPPFAIRNAFLIHGVIVILCWLMYLSDPEDVVWHFIKDSAFSRPLEHLAFGLAALCIACGICLGAWPGGSQINWVGQTTAAIRRRAIGEILHVIGIASLLPLAGSLALIGSESARSIHFARWKLAALNSQPVHSAAVHNVASDSLFLGALRHVAGICAFLSMLVFSITLRDRLADTLFAVTTLVFIVTRFVKVP